MERGTVVAALLAAVLAGGATGLGLHAWRPDPLGAAAARLDESGSASTPAAQGSATPTARPSHRSTPSSSPTPRTGAETATPTDPAGTPTPSGTTPSDDTDPAFTSQALLQPVELEQNGWATAEFTTRYDDLPGGAITPCAEMTSGDDGVVEGYAAGYASQRTGAIELVARFSTGTKARKEYSQLLDLVVNCASTAYTPKVRVTSAPRVVEADGVDEIRWFNTTGADGYRGVIGLVRSQNRLAYLSMSSVVSEPDDTRSGGTTDIAAVLTLAGRRLV